MQSKSDVAAASTGRYGVPGRDIIGFASASANHTGLICSTQINSTRMRFSMEKKEDG